MRPAWLVYLVPWGHWNSRSFSGLGMICFQPEGSSNNSAGTAGYRRCNSAIDGAKWQQNGDGSLKTGLKLARMSRNQLTWKITERWQSG